MIIIDNTQQILNKINNLNNLIDRKITNLTELLNITKTQNIIFNGNINSDTKDTEHSSIIEKQKLIDEITEIDSMFLLIFESFGGELNSNKQVFKQDIQQIQIKIQYVSQIDAKIRIQEENNRHLLESRLNKPNTKKLPVSRDYILKKYKQNAQNKGKDTI